MNLSTRTTSDVWSPASEIERIRDEFNRMLGVTTGDDMPGGFVPSADVEETDDAYLIVSSCPA